MAEQATNVHPARPIAVQSAVIIQGQPCAWHMSRKMKLLLAGGAVVGVLCVGGGAAYRVVRLIHRMNDRINVSEAMASAANSRANVATGVAAGSTAVATGAVVVAGRAIRQSNAAKAIAQQASKNAGEALKAAGSKAVEVVQASPSALAKLVHGATDICVRVIFPAAGDLARRILDAMQRR